MKRKTLLLIGMAYIVLLAVILVIGIPLSKKRPTPGAFVGEEGIATSIDGNTTEASLSDLRTPEPGPSDEAYGIFAQGTTVSFEIGDMGTGYPAQGEGTEESIFLPTETRSGILNPTKTQGASSSTAYRTPTSSTPTQTKVPTNMPTATRTATPTRTRTLQTGWGGEWTAYLAQPDGSYQSGRLIVSISGDSVTGVFDNGGITMNMEGSFQIDKTFVSGDYTSPSDSGSFKWRIQEDLYLIGNINNEWAFCAAREGFPQPNPCGYFDPR